jgi:flagellar protein FliS
MNFIIEGEKRMYQAQAMQENYLKTQVMSASPNKLIEMLLEGAIKKIRVAKLALETGKLAQMGENLLKAQDIVMELRYSINEEIESPIPQELIQLYEYMYQRLVIANVDRDIEAMDEVQKLLTELLDAWKQISEVK